jgi:hypothetical protein
VSGAAAGSDRETQPEVEGQAVPGSVIPPDGSAAVTGFGAGISAPDDVDEQDADLEGGADSAGAPGAPSGDAAP